MEQIEPRVQLRLTQYLRYCEFEGWTTQARQAQEFRHSDAYVSRLLRGRTKVTEDFIAAVLAAMPGRQFEDLFEVVKHAVPVRQAS
jgi:hypothetical protein